MKIKSLLAASLVALLTCQSFADTGPAGKKSGIDMTAVDPTVRPQDDFYDYVNGSWLKRTDIPADKSRLSMFSVLADQADLQLQAIIQDAAKAKAAKGTNQQKLGDLYNSFMDLATIDKLGFSPLKSDLQAIENVKTHKDVAAELGDLFVIGVDGPLGFYVYPDAKNPGFYGMWLNQSGLTLPDRDYYLKDDPKFVKYRSALKDYAAAVLTEAGYDEPARAADNVLAVETALAKIHIPRVEARDAEKNYNKRSVSEVEELLKGFDWEAYAQASEVGDAKEMIVRNMPFFQAFGKFFEDTGVQAWKDYMAFHLVDSHAPLLPQKFVDLHFGFHSNTLQGIPQNQPRWKRAVGLTSNSLGEVLGQEYVKRHFSPEAKARMGELVQNLIKAYAASIKEGKWMSEETKERALQKLAAFHPKIGYPDKWRDYSALSIDPDNLIGNVMASAKFEHEYQVNKIGKPVDPVDWGMTPQTVNAYYSATRNEIVFPAAILQPPFFNLEADDAANYGAIGGVIGHEIGHGFDDQGSKYDGGGNLKSWWTEADRKAFDDLGARLAAQYDKFSPLEGMHVNGKLTLGENIGDLSGVTIGYKAYQMSLDGKEPPVIDGLTGPQRFFMGWAQVWRGKIREDALRARLLSDPHSPAECRVTGPLRNVDAFYQAFNVEKGDKMYLPPEDRVKIW